MARKALVFLSREFPEAIAHVTNEFEIALEAAVGTEPGIVLIATVNSAAFGRNAAGTVAVAGGFGRWIGDEGSAFEIGRRAVACAARARDQSGAATLLSQTLPVAVGSSAWDAFVESIALNAGDVFPRLLPVIFTAAELGDAVACEVLSSSALSLADLGLAVMRRLNLPPSGLQVVKYGSVFVPGSLVDTVFDQVFLDGAPQAKISRLEVSPALGAAALASRLARSTQSAVRVHAAND